MSRTLFSLAILLCSCAAAPSANASGPPAILWAAVDTLKRCKIIDVPDIPARPFLDASGVVHMIVGSTSYHRMEGPSLYNLTRECQAAWNESASPDPSM
jgi:hypothetical protein